MKRKLLAGLLISSVVATSVFANCGMMNNQKGAKYESKKAYHMNKSNHKKGRHILAMFKQLNLTSEQKTKIKEIMLENRKNRKTVNEAFTKNSFDKQKYLEITSQKRENMLKSRADMIEKVYELLTTKQKEQLKVLMDLKKEKRS